MASKISSGDTLFLKDGRKTRVRFICGNGRIAIVGHSDETVFPRDVERVIYRHPYKIGDLVQFDPAIAEYIYSYKCKMSFYEDPLRKYVITKVNSNGRNTTYDIAFQNGTRYMSMVNPYYFKQRGCSFSEKE